MLLSRRPFGNDYPKQRIRTLESIWKKEKTNENNSNGRLTADISNNQNLK